VGLGFIATIFVASCHCFACLWFPFLQPFAPPWSISLNSASAAAPKLIIMLPPQMNEITYAIYMPLLFVIAVPVSPIWILTGICDGR
jgi:hypothetical protein